jgi:penicillin-binding protein 1A
VLGVERKRIRARLRSGDDIELGASEIQFARRYLSEQMKQDKRLTRGSIVRVARIDAKAPWQLTYLPQVETAFVALAPANGAIRAMVGGVDFSKNQFNHVTQALRQAGSSFKPFVYSAALERGITPATVFEDAPIIVDPAETGGISWEPKNYDGTMEGPLTLRNALAKSKNLVSIRVLNAAGMQSTQQHIANFGFDMSRIPPYMTMALGAGEITPLSLAAAYAVFANGGSAVTPWHLLRVTDNAGRVLEDFVAPPLRPAIDPRNAFITTSLMQDVIRRGTATAALKLGRADLAGKTGTTNDHHDAWFAGFQATRVAVAWMGYDKPRPLGTGETGGGTALPIWVRYMKDALRQTPVMPYVMPAGVITARVNPVTGAPDETEQGVIEYFFEEYPPGLPIITDTPAAPEAIEATPATPASPVTPANPASTPAPAIFSFQN